MEIEIYTTAKKLSKSIINQMRRAKLPVLLNGEVLGYMIKVKKDSYKTILIKHTEEYFVIDSGWRKGESTVFRSVGKWSRTKQFSTHKKCDEWWQAYERILKDAKIQIYI